MVRLKNRYLLVNILYPGIEHKPVNSKIPDFVVFNQPTTDTLTPQALLRGLKAEISNLFGDYGSGATADSLQGKYINFWGRNGILISVQSNIYPLLLRHLFSESLAHITGLSGPPSLS
jgi:hypothetical protein